MRHFTIGDRVRKASWPADLFLHVQWTNSRYVAGELTNAEGTVGAKRSYEHTDQDGFELFEPWNEPPKTRTVPVVRRVPQKGDLYFGESPGLEGTLIRAAFGLGSERDVIVGAA